MATIRMGDTGDDVKTLQALLTDNGFHCVSDGDFGPITESKVKAFQNQNGLDVDGIVGPATWASLKATSTPPAPDPIPPILRHAESIGHKIWGEPWRLWLFGIRSPNREANSFDDMMGCAYVDDDGLWKMHYWPATCDPGTYWLENPMRVSGTAILVPGQYEAWEIGTHRTYEALVQKAGRVKVYRDGNKDNTLEMNDDSIIDGYFGINLHASTRRDGGESSRVEKWSAGCQVHATEAGFSEMMSLAHKQVEKTGRKSFTYCLMDQWW